MTNNIGETSMTFKFWYRRNGLMATLGLFMMLTLSACGGGGSDSAVPATAGATASSSSSSSTSSVSSTSSSSSSAASSSSSSAATTATATLTWTKPTLNTDGSTLSDLTGYRIYYGTSASAVSSKTSTSVTVPDANMLTAQIAALPVGQTYYFGIASIATSGEGNISNLASKVM